MNETVNAKLHFQRFEFKYLITPDEEKEITDDLKRYMNPDPFAQESQGNSYEVLSLYYDSPGFYCYQEKIDGVKKRKKIRLRTYRNDSQFVNYAFFEIKRKHDAVVLKDRFLLSYNDYEKLIDNEDFHNTAVIRDKNRKSIIKEYEWERHLRCIVPKVLVTYTRVPFLGKYNNNFRITFDKDIKAVENDNLFYKGNDYADVSCGQVVMEIKFNGVLPSYISEIIQKFNLQRLAYSKYCNGVDSCGSLSAYTFPNQHLLDNIYLPNQEPIWEIF